MKNKQGFSLIELLVVIVVIGLIASFATIKYSHFVARTRASEGVHLLTALRGAQERYFVSQEAYAGGVGCLPYNDPSLNPSLDIEISKMPDNFDIPRVCNGAGNPPIIVYIASTISGVSASIYIDSSGNVGCLPAASADCRTIGY